MSCNARHLATATGPNSSSCNLPATWIALRTSWPTTSNRLQGCSKFQAAVEAAGYDVAEIAAHGDRVRAAIKAQARTPAWRHWLPDQGFGGTARGRILKTGLPGYNSVGEGGRFARRLRQLSNQLRDAETQAQGSEAARIANEMRTAIVDFSTPLWRRPVAVREELLAKLRSDLQRVAGPRRQAPSSI
jgi:hypothetical protein